MVVDIFLVYQFIKRLVTPFKDWKAFKLGIIDEKGTILKKRKTLTKIKERESFGVFDVMILKLKRLLEKLPGGQARIKSYAAALWLIKEGKNYNEDTQINTIEESFMKYYNSLILKEDLNVKFEEVINTAGSGNIAGLPPDEPPGTVSYRKFVKKKMLRRKKPKDNAEK